MRGATAGLVLAAGEGRRFGGPKAPYVLDGVRLVDRAVALLRDAGCDPVLVVLGAWIDDVPDAVVVVNEQKRIRENQGRSSVLAGTPQALSPMWSAR